MPNFMRQYWKILFSTLVIFLILVGIDITLFVRPETVAEEIPVVSTDAAQPQEQEATSSSSHIPSPPPEKYIEIVDSCGPSFTDGECVYGHMHIGEEHMPVMRLRTGMVLKVGGVVVIDDENWYEVVFDEWLRYPERLTSELLVRESDVKLYVGTTSTSTSSSTKRIVVDRSEQKLRAYDGDTLFMEATTSTGLDITPTPRGTFTVFRKTPSRYMQGPIPGISDKQYDLPGVPWNLYFTHEGAVIHGAYWHDRFGTQWSNGCVNLPPPIAKELYEWAEVGMTVVVQD
jgi:hypothetical protein